MLLSMDKKTLTIINKMNTMNFKQNIKFKLSVFFFIISFSMIAYAKVDEKKNEHLVNLSNIETMMQAKLYKEASAKLITLNHQNEFNKKDYGTYLLAMMAYYQKEDKKVLNFCNELEKSFPKSKWLRKSQFLKAKSYIRLKEHEKANAIYEAEANRLFAEPRKQRIALVLVDFADDLSVEPKASDLSTPPANYNKAHSLYQECLKLDISRTLRDRVLFKSAKCLQALKRYREAEVAYRSYLGKFDPSWAGKVGSSERFRGQLKENPEAKGKFWRQARFHLVEVQLAQCGQSVVVTAGINHQKFNVSQYAKPHLNRLQVARQNIEDLIKMLSKEKSSALLSDASWTLVRTYNPPYPVKLEMDKCIDVMRSFMKQFPSHPRATDCSKMIAKVYQNNQRIDDAIKAYEDFHRARHYTWVPEDGKIDPKIKTGKSCAFTYDKWLKESFYEIGSLRYAQKEYRLAIAAWESYINKYPNGEHWANCQGGIIQTEYQIGLDLVKQKKMKEAKKHFEKFLKKNPLDARSRQILFIFGQMSLSSAESLKEKNGDHSKEIHAHYQQAILQWARLISKYPNTEESSLALYRTALIQEENLDDMESALASYMRLKWGTWYSKAAQKVKTLTDNSLNATTERSFRSDEKAYVKIKTRNVKKIKVSQYFVNLESYFRKTHNIDKIENLDIDLIEADKTWEVEIDNYKDYKLCEQNIEIPFHKNKLGACVVKIREKDFETTVLVLKTDIDLILKSNREEALVYVEDRLNCVTAAGVKILLSDGEKIISTGETGEDGVFRTKLENLKTQKDLRVFALSNKGNAANDLSLSGLGVNEKLNDKGYIYTHKTIYRPGERVSFKAMIRNVLDGSYVVSENSKVLVQILDLNSRLIWQKEMTLNDFGTLNENFELSKESSIGMYTIKVSPINNAKQVYSGTFYVNHFKTEKMVIDLDFSKQVYFRGEKIKAQFKVEYYWGSPVENTMLNYSLPDGRQFSERTNEKGIVSIDYDASGFSPGSILIFTGRIEGEGISVNKKAVLAQHGFKIKVDCAQKIALSDEPFDVNISTLSASDAIVSKNLKLSVYRRSHNNQQSLLSKVPWLSTHLTNTLSAEVKISEQNLVTDKESGKARISLRLKKGGNYIIRVSGEDRFEQTITKEGRIKISDDQDDIKLRFLVNRSHYKVGEKVRMNLHSRLENGLALITFEGSDIISHRVVKVELGNNMIELPIEHKHFPNFRIAAVLMHGKKLLSCHKEFTVERKLFINIDNQDEIFLPESHLKLNFTVTDQMGAPVESEFSLALVKESIYLHNPNSRKKIIPFFHGMQKRKTEFSVISTAGFKYRGVSRGVEKSFDEEQKRMAEKDRKKKNLLAAQSSGYGYGNFNIRSDMKNGRKLMDNQAPMTQIKINRWKEDADDLIENEEVFFESKMLNQSSPEIQNAPLVQKFIREEEDDSSQWFPVITSNKQGKASLEITLPKSINKWRFTAVGCSRDTLVGEIKKNIITKKDFFVEIKCPSTVQEGDELEVIARLHNLTENSGMATLTLSHEGGEAQSKDIEFKKQSVTEVVFGMIKVPAGEKFKLNARAKYKELVDELNKNMWIRSWGLQYRTRTGGMSNGDTSVDINLTQQQYRWKQLVLSLSPTIDESIVELALQRSPIVQPLSVEADTRIIMPPKYNTYASELLGAVSALEYCVKRQVSDEHILNLKKRIRNCMAALVVTQNSQGSWSMAKRVSWYQTMLSYRALAKAKNNGFYLKDDVLLKAETCLKNQYRRISSSDRNTKIQFQFALSSNGKADFSNVNRLFRERNYLNKGGLARLAITLHDLKHSEMALEVLELLETKKGETLKQHKHSIFYWPNEGNLSSQNGTEISALSLLAYALLKPDSERAKALARGLLHKKGCFSFSYPNAQGVVITALTAFYGKAKQEKVNYELDVLLNGEKVKTIKSDSLKSVQYFSLPTEYIKVENKLSFVKRGVGAYHYGVSLTGFSAEMKNPKTLSKMNRIQARRYIHDKLSYRNVPINVNSTSPVTELEMGQRIRVEASFYHRHYYKETLVFEETIPTGTMLVKGSVNKGSAARYEVVDGKIIFYFANSVYPNTVQYQLVAYAPGVYKVLPGILRDSQNPNRIIIGPESKMVVLKPGLKSKDQYKINYQEHYALSKLMFADGNYKDALEHLNYLFEKKKSYYEKDIARMLLWIYTKESFFNEKKIVEMFEILRERHPELTIPFDKIFSVGKAYKLIGEHERAWLVYRAIIDSSFVQDTNVSAVLEDQGQFLGSMDYLKGLWYEYPNRATMVASYFAWANTYFTKAPQALQLAKADKQRQKRLKNKKQTTGKVPNEVSMLKESVRMARQFLTLFPEDPQADTAAFSLVNTFFSLEDYKRVVQSAQMFTQWYPESELKSSFQYMAAIGSFWQQDYSNALKTAIQVSKGDSKDKQYAQYITAQIYHTQGDAEKAINWYKTISKLYPDAQQAIDYFQKQDIKMPEINSFKPGEKVKLKIDYRNIKETAFQVYKVDLMKLYLREKNLSNITKVNLAGIEPTLEMKMVFGNGKDYRDKDKEVELNLKDEGAYLVICRGDDLFTSGLVLISSLKLEIQESAQSGLVRVNVIDRESGSYIPKVHIKAIGSMDQIFKSGETDLRGIYAMTGLNGKATVIARSNESQYAFYRGEDLLGNARQLNRHQRQRPVEQQEQMQINDYLQNSIQLNRQQNTSSQHNWENVRRAKGRGVQIKYAK